MKSLTRLKKLDENAPETMKAFWAFDKEAFEAGVEIHTFVVSDRRRRPHDKPQDTAFHGEANGGYNSVPSRRSHSVGQCARESCRDDYGSKAGSVFLVG
jgi:hypothetical protein